MDRVHLVQCVYSVQSKRTSFVFGFSFGKPLPFSGFLFLLQSREIGLITALSFGCK